MDAFEDFIANFCRFEKYQFGDGSEDFLFEVKPLLIRCAKKYSSRCGLIIKNYNFWVEKFIETCVRLGHKDVHQDEHSKVLNYTGPVVFGFRFKPEIYNLITYRDRSIPEQLLISDNENDLVLETFIKNNLVYRKNASCLFSTVYAAYKEICYNAQIQSKTMDETVAIVSRHIPQMTKIHTKRGVEMRCVDFIASGLNHFKIQNFLNSERIKISG